MGGRSLARSTPQLLPRPVLFSIRRSFSTSFVSASSGNGHFHRSDFTSQGFSGYYDAGAPTVGPLADASSHGVPTITPKILKQHLDQFVVGQERAKKVLSTAVYNHYQRVREIQRREDEEAEQHAQNQRWEMASRHPVEEEFPGQQPTVNTYRNNTPPPTSRIGSNPLIDQTPLIVEKSNVLLLGPSGVGKTLMAKTLARVLEVPFSMSDCTAFTQAGYIGEDVEVCIQRLLAAADYDVARAEHGIICLDEIDKIATAKVSHGKDVSGEGVQQALLKIIEGTTIQVSAKPDRGPGSNRGHNPAPSGGHGSGGSNLGNPGGSGSLFSSPPTGKGETYNINTDNILFICTGAFIGLHRNIMDRIARGSIGFGATVRASHTSSASSSTSVAELNDPTMRRGNPEADELFRTHLPYFTPPSAPQNASRQTNGIASATAEDAESDTNFYNILDLATPGDLQKYGIIPELTGRIPITCALAPLSLSQLTRVLTEPRNALLAQYTQTLHLSGIELKFTSEAIHEVANAAKDAGTGARGLRTVMEQILGEAMYEAPGPGQLNGQPIRWVLVTGSTARKEEGVRYFTKGMGKAFAETVKDEEEAWERRKRKNTLTKEEEEEESRRNGGSKHQTFEQYRERVRTAGFG